MLDLLAFGAVECSEDGVQLRVSLGVEGEREDDWAYLIRMGHLLAVGTGLLVLEVLSDAELVKDVSAIETDEVFCQFLQADSA
jgi:hypothetical protein